jgi:hypothetical protein
MTPMPARRNVSGFRFILKPASAKDYDRQRAARPEPRIK